ncbi:TPA: hypothetical protein DDW35_10425 [Candidatus Sumerlaeota bacterium]|nr:hypothetical protein [Candidatus Sumerlaeota bacterium]
MIIGDGYEHPDGSYCEYSDVSTLEQAAAQMAQALELFKKFREASNQMEASLWYDEFTKAYAKALAAYREAAK